MAAAVFSDLGAGPPANLNCLGTLWLLGHCCGGLNHHNTGWPVKVQFNPNYSMILYFHGLFPVSIPWQHLDLEFSFRKIHIFLHTSFSWQPLFSSCPTGGRYLSSLRCSISAAGGLRVQETSVPWGHIQWPGLLQLGTHGDSHYRAKLISFL